MTIHCPIACGICERAPVDLDESCPNWAHDNGCFENPGAVLKACGNSCGLEACEDKNSTQCESWSEEQCAANPGAMLRECPATCGVCRQVCKDKHESCAAWAAAGECTANAKSMRALCSSSCFVCASIELAFAGDADKDEI